MSSIHDQLIAKYGLSPTLHVKNWITGDGLDSDEYAEWAKQNPEKAAEREAGLATEKNTGHESPINDGSEKKANRRMAKKDDKRVAVCRQNAHDRKICDGKTVVVGVVIPAEWATEIDARRGEMSRSRYLRHAVAAYIGKGV